MQQSPRSPATMEERLTVMEFDAFRQAAGSRLHSERELRQAAEERAVAAVESAAAAAAAAAGATEGVRPRTRRSPRALNFSQQPRENAPEEEEVEPMRPPAANAISSLGRAATEQPEVSMISWSPRSIHGHSNAHVTAAAPLNGGSVPVLAAAVETAAARAVREMGEKLARVEAELQAARSQRPQRHSPSPSPSRARLNPAQAAPVPAAARPQPAAASTAAAPRVDYAQAARLNELSLKAAQVQEELRRAREARGGYPHSDSAPMGVPLVASPEPQQRPQPQPQPQPWQPSQWQQQDMAEAQVDELRREFSQLGSHSVRAHEQRARSPRRSSSPVKRATTPRTYSPDQPRGAAFGVMRVGRFDDKIARQRGIQGGRPTYHKTMQ